MRGLNLRQELPLIGRPGVLFQEEEVAMAKEEKEGADLGREVLGGKVEKGFEGLG